MIKKMKIRKFPHLNGAMLMVGVEGTGLCIHRAAAFVLDTPGAELCFGTLDPATEEARAKNPLLAAVPFIHAWAEHHGMVYAPTTIERAGNKLVPMGRSYYYGMNGVRDVHRLSRRALLTLSGEIGLSAHLRKGTPAKKSVGATLLDAAGVRWMDGPDGGLLPLPEKEVEKVLDD
jgi:hypothetical protein